MRFLLSEAAEVFYDEVEKRLNALLSAQTYTCMENAEGDEEELRQQILRSERERLRHKVIAELNSESSIITYGKAKYDPQIKMYEKQD